MFFKSVCCGYFLILHYNYSNIINTGKTVHFSLFVAEGFSLGVHSLWAHLFITLSNLLSNKQ